MGTTKETVLSILKHIKSILNESDNVEITLIGIIISGGLFAFCCIIYLFLMLLLTDPIRFIIVICLLVFIFCSGHLIKKLLDKYV